MDKKRSDNLNLKIYSPPGWIESWEDEAPGDNVVGVSVVSAMAAFAGGVVGAIVAAFNNGAWSLISTSILVSLPTLVILAGLFSAISAKVYRHTHKGYIRTKNLSDIQRVTLSRYSQQLDEDKVLIRPIVKAMLLTDIDEEQDTLSAQFDKVLQGLETQKVLLRKLSPNPALDEAKRIREHVEAMNKELTDQLNGVDKRYSD